MTVREEHEQCIGRAFTQRKVARKNLKAAQERLTQAGEWMRLVGARMCEFSTWDIQEEHGMLVFYEQHTRHREHMDTAVPLPTQEEIITLFQTVRQLNRDITELNMILGDED